MRNTITGVLILCACLTIEATPWAIVMVLAALAIQGGRHGKTSRRTH